MTLRDVVNVLFELDEEAVIFTDGASPAAQAMVVGADDAASAKDAGLRYFLEVALAWEAVVVWSEWRGGAEPTIDDKLLAISYYASNDAFLPTD